MNFQKLTPNLVVRNVAASMEFYRSVLGFQPAMHVPDEPRMCSAQSLRAA
jgi:catechol 2,3-dioxygenase-like lactoylglutathione lyase family enzyme